MYQGPRLGARTLSVDFCVFSPDGSCIHSQILRNAAVGHLTRALPLRQFPVSPMGAARGVGEHRGELWSKWSPEDN